MLSPSIIFSIAAFVGNFGVTLTGFGMAIFFLFVYTIGDVSGGMECDRCTIKDAVFYQSLALGAGLPTILYAARDVIREHRNKSLLITFIPSTIIGTPIGNFLQDHLPGYVIKVIVGVAIITALMKTLMNLVPETKCYKKYVLEEDAGGEVKNDGGDDIKQEKSDNEKVDDCKKDSNLSDKEIGEDESKNLHENGNEKKDACTQMNAEVLNGLSIRFWGAMAGFFSGFLGGLVGIRGPPLMVFFLMYPFPKNVIRANSMIILVVNILIRITYYIVEDLSGVRELSWFEARLWYLYISVIICGLLGVPLGQYVAARINQHQFKLVIAFMLLLSGVSNIVKGSIETALRGL